MRQGGSTRVMGMGPTSGRTEPLDIIWNLTAICPWDCAVCCVAAVNVRQRDGRIIIRGPGLSNPELVERDAALGSIFDQTLLHRQRRGLELTLPEKLRVIAHLDSVPVRLDISGGDPLSSAENYSVLEAAARALGPESVTLTATAAGLARYDLDSVAANIAELNFTYDGVPPSGDAYRPATFARGNLRRARQFASRGVTVRAECPLTTQNIRPHALGQIYTDLAEAGVATILLMRLFPVGRGARLSTAIPTIAEYRNAIELLRDLEDRLGGPQVRLQCALRALDGPSAKNPCDAIQSSFGLMWDGTFLGSPWAINDQGRPIDGEWVLGNLARTPLSEVLAGDRVRDLRARCADNHGHCKIFSWLNGAAPDSRDRMFERSDPLLAGQVEGTDVA